ncbi:MAG: cyclic lactone autoinducer peptide [Christensenellaceae bacterium]
MKTLLFRLGSCFAGLALLVTALNINLTCMMYAHQPKLPEAAKKLRKF